MKKKLAISITINNNGVCNIENESMNSDDIEKFCVDICNLGADELLIHSYDIAPLEHDNAIAVIKYIKKNVEIPVSVYFPFKGIEDIDKLMYADVDKIILNLSVASNWDILEEVSKKFGSRKVAVTWNDYSNLYVYRVNVEKYASSIYLFEHGKVSDVASSISLPCMSYLPDVYPEKILETISMDNVEGIFGRVIDGNISMINDIKLICADRGIDVSILRPQLKWSELKLNESGLIPVIVTDYKTKDVLMLAYMNEEAYNQTLKSGKMNYYSRSRKSQWEKGETSGHFQYVKSLYADCDKDTLLACVYQIGPACHTGSRSCFFNEIAAKKIIEKNPLKIFEALYDSIAENEDDFETESYSERLSKEALDKILKKIGEKSTDLIIAAKDTEDYQTKYEICDLLYQMTALMVQKDITWDDVVNELSDR